MKAVYFEKTGGPEVLKEGSFPDPVVLKNGVLVEVKACALNRLDIWIRQGALSVPIPMPHILGADVAGTVLEVAKGVKGLKKGRRVVLSPGQLLKNPKAYEGRDSYSPDFTILGFQTQGGYAEKVAVDARFALPVSDRYSFEEWASFPLAALTAYHMLVTRARLKKGETVLVHAAGSGIGGFAIQVAKKLGAKVFTTVGGPEKIAPARKLGADEIILYRTEDFSHEVRKLTGDRGVDVIFEHIGPDTWPKNLACLARGGRMVTCGATSGPKAEIDIRYLFAKQLSVLGSYMGSLSELKEVFQWAEKGHLKPTLDRVFPLAEAAQAHRRMESRGNFGKIVLKV